MKKLFALLLALCMVISMCACELKLPLPFGKKDTPPEETAEPKPVETAEPTEAEDPNLGKYYLFACQVDNVILDPKTFVGEDNPLFFQGDITVELKKSGRAVLEGDGEKSTGKYEIDDDELYISVDGEDIYGTIEDGLMWLEADDFTIIFAKEDADTSGFKLMSMEEYLNSLGGTSGGSTTGTPATSGGTVAWGSGDGYYVEVLGVEPFVDWDGEDSIRIYYEFTNTSDEVTTASYLLNIEVYQDNCALDETYGAAHELDGNAYLSLRPGVTVRCICEYNYDSYGGAIRFMMRDWMSGKNAIDVNLDPARLPAPPAPGWSPAPIWDPTWTDVLDWEGTVGDFYVYIDTAEITEDYEGRDCIRVFYYITNGNTEERYPYDLHFALYQDGIALQDAWADDDTASDDAIYEPIPPKQDRLVSTVHRLRSDSPIEVEVREYWNDSGAVGGIFN